MSSSLTPAETIAHLRDDLELQRTRFIHLLILLETDLDSARSAHSRNLPSTTSSLLELACSRISAELVHLKNAIREPNTRAQWKLIGQPSTPGPMKPSE